MSEAFIARLFSILSERCAVSAVFVVRVSQDADVGETNWDYAH